MTNRHNTFLLRIFFALILLGGFGYCMIPAAQAITLIPPSIEIGLKPGKEYSIMIKLYNETEKTLELYTEARNFTAKGETGQPEFDFDGEPFGITQWLDIEEGPIVIEPDKRYEVPVKINTPTDADPGGHYATVFFSTSPPDDGQVTISSKVGTLILARVDGDITEDGSITEFSTLGAESIYNRPPVEMFARYTNNGNVHLRPTGKITIENMLGSEVASVDFNTSKGATLPNVTRRYEAVWEKGPVTDVSGNAWTRFWKEYGNETANFALGKHTATLSVTAGTNGAVTSSQSLSFWVFPWRVLLVWGVVVLVVIVGVIFGLKKYNAWIVKKSQTK